MQDALGGKWIRATVVGPDAFAKWEVYSSKFSVFNDIKDVLFFCYRCTRPLFSSIAATAIRAMWCRNSFAATSAALLWRFMAIAQRPSRAS